mmetsp:Transcript_66275/g.156005  ORF Transcript_66275/g.156005 Transcript_66275/m.156005 type:complete len:528 (+) Transcript_66275:37-1620(+)
MALRRISEAWSPVLIFCMLVAQLVHGTETSGNRRLGDGECCTPPPISHEELHQAGQDGTCAKAYVEDCGSNGRCCDPGMTCFEKHAKWAACMPSCNPGVQPFVDWFWKWTPWTCLPLVVHYDDMEKPLDVSAEPHPFRSPDSRHQYDRFRRKSTASGYTLYQDEQEMRLTFVDSVDLCKDMCDKERRCDCLQYTINTGHCEIRRSCAVSLEALEDTPDTDLYIKLPQEGDPVVWKKESHDNLFFSSGLTLEDEDRGQSTLDSCKRRCELSQYCQCLTYLNVTADCHRYTDCAPSSLIVDYYYDVYVKEKPAMQDPEDVAWWAVWQSLFVALLLTLCCCLSLYFRRKESTDVRLLPIVPTKPRLDIALADAAVVVRWPGKCASCGCDCGRPPSWIPRDGAVVVTEADVVCSGASSPTPQTRSQPQSRRLSTLMDDAASSEKLIPGDVLVSIGRDVIQCTDDVEEALRTCQLGQLIDIAVLRARTFGEYSCSRDEEADPTRQVTMSKPDEVVQAAMPTHKKVRVRRVVR